tara:strand:+ start:616 stop:804 length:189 start_codon:yes stop_codon:yes gene_type:complete
VSHGKTISVDWILKIDPVKLKISSSLRMRLGFIDGSNWLELKDSTASLSMPLTLVFQGRFQV